MAKMRQGDMPYRHSQSHGTDHSGAHARGTHHHKKHSSNPADGLMPGEMPSAPSPGAGPGDDPALPGGGTTPGSGGFSPGGSSAPM